MTKRSENVFEAPFEVSRELLGNRSDRALISDRFHNAADPEELNTVREKFDNDVLALLESIDDQLELSN